MSRYIDFYLIGELVDSHGNVHYEDLKNLPTADVVEVKHGEWQVYYDEDSPQDGIWKCSICNYIRLIDDISPTSFCPNCGADMRGK